MSCFAPVAPKMITSNSSAFMTPIAMARWKRVDLCPSERCQKGNVDERSIEIGQTGIHKGKQEGVRCHRCHWFWSKSHILLSVAMDSPEFQPFSQQGKGYSPKLATRWLPRSWLRAGWCLPCQPMKQPRRRKPGCFWKFWCMSWNWKWSQIINFFCLRYVLARLFLANHWTDFCSYRV